MIPIVLTLCLVLVFPPPAFGFFGSLTIEKEKDLGEEFSLLLQQYYPVVRDPYLTAYINTIGQKLVKQLGPQPFQYRFFILEDPTYNAFAVPGGYIFVNTGIIRLMDREDELAGVLAHEITHIHQRHIAKRMEKGKFTTIATVLGALAAVLLGGEQPRLSLPEPWPPVNPPCWPIAGKMKGSPIPWDLNGLLWLSMTLTI